tara:strand:- start:248 stop:451 length:204 start_codon:yes stop_codon:yes gene_type:complete
MKKIRPSDLPPDLPPDLPNPKLPNLNLILDPLGILRNHNQNALKEKNQKLGEKKRNNVQKKINNPNK